jgi:hypothetical protein
MSTIELTVPDELTGEADQIRSALADFLALAAADTTETAREPRYLAPSLIRGSKGSGKTANMVLLLEALSRSQGGLEPILLLMENLATRHEVLRHVTDTIANQPIPIGSATAAQIAMVDQTWRELENRYGTFDAGQYAELVGSSPKSRSAASKAKSKGLVGYRRGRKLLYPRFQFDGRGIKRGWSDIVTPLRTAGWDDEDIILWLVAPHGSLDRQAPVEALEAGERDLVLDLIRDETAGVW